MQADVFGGLCEQTFSQVMFQSDIELLFCEKLIY